MMRVSRGVSAWMCSVMVAVPAFAGSKPGRDRAPESSGKSLFHHEWRPGDSRSRDGDGLGPVFNARSCVGCHSLGGSGGGGTAPHNVQILTPIINNPGAKPRSVEEIEQLAHEVRAQTGLPSSGSVVLHRFGTNPEYAPWRKDLLKKSFTSFSLRRSERNTPALFGAGLIDSIPAAVIEAAARRTFTEYPDLHGRVSRLKDGQIGRFGWKGHTPTLKEFVLTACSVEVGLDVPGHAQSGDPSVRETTDPGHDLTAEDCAALVEYVRGFPAPGRLDPPSDALALDVVKGEVLFEFVGCASCHTPQLGRVKGIYSDLLLHDMGRSLGDQAAYYGSDQEIGSPPAPALAVADAPTDPDKTPKTGVATSLEWRTPPLWGLRDSAPYLHDGRARSLPEAIALHGGEAAPIVSSYQNLLEGEKRQLLTFLLTLAAPPDADHPFRRVSQPARRDPFFRGPEPLSIAPVSPGGSLCNFLSLPVVGP